MKLPSKSTNKCIRFEFCNARSICNKLHLLSNYLLSRNDLDLLFITETWLTSKYTDSMVCPSGFNIMRFDRPTKRGGGVLVVYRSGLHVHRVDVSLPSNLHFELICFDLYSYNSCVRFCCIYLPPTSSSSYSLTSTSSSSSLPIPPPVQRIDDIVSLCNTLTPLILPDKPVLIFGDFNLPHIDWSIPSSTVSSEKCNTYFLDFCSSNSLFQLIDFPTHDKGNVLDLLLCNYNAKEILINTSSSAPPWTADHFLISSTLSINDSLSSNTSAQRPSYPDFKNANYEMISNVLVNTNWDFLTTTSSLQTIYDEFCTVLSSIIEDHVPLVTARAKKGVKQPKNIRNLLSRKRLLYKKSKSDATFKSAYKKASKDYDIAVNRRHDTYESKLCQDPNSKKLYSFVNAKLKSKHSIPPIEKEDSSLAFSDIEKANLFNSAFQKFFTIDNNVPFSTSPPRQNMPKFQISPEDIRKSCLKMNKKLSRTPEGIPTYFLANVIDSLLYPLTIIFNISLSHNTIPSQWKSALIVPIFKKGDRSKFGNYRPISLTSSISRLFEAVLLDKLMAHTQKHNLLSCFQFGFLPKRSSCSNILSSVHSWIASYSTSKCTNILYTDIQKAFDSVNHRFLVNVLRSFGINAQAVNWIENFLSGRKQQVCLNSAVSSILPVLSGVPQGSVIGPFLFLLFIDGLTTTTSYSPNVNIRLFADDSKLFSTEPLDLQNTIDASENWLSQRQLQLAPHKCAILKISKPSVSNDSKFKIKNHFVEEVPHFKDLGIVVSRNLSWTAHIDAICHTASVTSYQLYKSIRTKNIWTWMKLFNTYVRPKLEYCTPVWSPSFQGEIDKVEAIQRRFTKFAFQRCGIPFKSYEDRIKKIGYLTLRRRRKFFDLVLLYKMLNNISDLNFQDYFSLVASKYNLRSHPFQIMPKIKFQSPQFVHSFFGRIPSLWNELPTKLVKSPSLHSFKQALKLHLLL